MGGKHLWDPRSSTVERMPDELVLTCGPPGIMAAPHWHAQAEVNYVLRGAMEYDMHGPGGRHRLRLGAGTVALFWGGLPHRVVDTAEDTFFHAVHLPVLQFFRLRIAADLQQRLMRGAVLATRGAQADDAAAFTRRARYLSSGDPRLVAHAVDDLLLRLERVVLEPHDLREPNPAAPPGEDAGEASRFHAIGRMCGFIAGNFREDIASADVARAADIHPKYAMAAFKRATGLTLGEYLGLLRVSYAQGLLMRGDSSIVEVAMDSGFGSVSAFNKCFRKKAGMTPSDFRREHRVLSLAAAA